jgi:uncharacterized protein
VFSPALVVAEGESLQIQGRISDQAQIISSSQEHQLYQLLAQHAYARQQNVTVLTITTSGAETAQDYAARQWRSWQPRSKATSVLLVLFKEQKTAAIFAGDALSKLLDEAVIKQILAGELASNLQRGDFDNAVMEGVKALVAELNG